MELKRIVRSCVLSILIVLMFTITVLGDTTGVLTYGRIAVNMPEITVEIKGSGYDSADVSAILGSETLSVVSVKQYNKAEDTTCAYILIDLSTSMRRSFDLVKTNIIKYVNGMGAKDKLVAITFGENDVVTILDGDETKQEIIDTINGLKCNENGTMFYEALNRAYQLSNASISEFTREYVLVFSDGIDVQRGNTTYDEITGYYKTHILPLYAACSANTSQDASNRFGELARSSGGSFKIIESEADFDTLLNEVNNVTLIKLLAASNVADGQERQLSVKIGELQVEQNVPIIRSIADTTAPTVDEISFDEDSKSIQVAFSEAVKRSSDATSYIVTDEEGNVVEIASVTNIASQNAVSIKLKDVHNGDYTITFNNITDNSKESNPLNETQTIIIENVVEEVVASEEPDKEEGIPAWAIILIVMVVLVIVIVIVILIVLTIKRKNEQAREEMAITSAPEQKVQPVVQEVDVVDHMANVQKQVKHHIKNNDFKHIRLIIKTGKNSEQRVEMDITSSVIVGRSEICDICIDDTKLSRQHFVIEYEAGFVYVMDLQSRNGTMLNGIRVGSRQMLQNGDKIAAGLSDIIIQF